MFALCIFIWSGILNTLPRVCTQGLYSTITCSNLCNITRSEQEVVIWLHRDQYSATHCTGLVWIGAQVSVWYNHVGVVAACTLAEIDHEIPWKSMDSHGNLMIQKQGHIDNTWKNTLCIFSLTLVTRKWLLCIRKSASLSSFALFCSKWPSF